MRHVASDAASYPVTRTGQSVSAGRSESAVYSGQGGAAWSVAGDEDNKGVNHHDAEQYSA